MAKGISLHVGLNRVADSFRADPLRGCLKDAGAMSEIAALRHFAVRPPLLDGEATFDKVVNEIRAAAAGLEAGDIFLFTFAGHGTRVEDGELEELDGKDEAFVLFDHLLLDDVLRRGLWPLFAPGVRVLVVADSCHSGTVTQVPVGLVGDGAADNHTPYKARPPVDDEGFFDVSRGGPERTISDGARLQHLDENRDFYNDFLRGLPKDDPINATVLLLAACEDFDRTHDGPDNGVFTKALLEVLNGGAFAGDYEAYRTAIQQWPPLPSRNQVPQLLATGATLSPEFRFTKPVFAI
ncbi:MAG TPA: caspase family protein [Pyrinomonadaceae bacterium]|jgi:hypothetical protein